MGFHGKDSSLTPRFPSLSTADLWDWIILCARGCLVHCRVFSSISGLTTKVHLVKALVFPVAMYGPESWTIKKAEHRRIVAFELWC